MPHPAPLWRQNVRLLCALLLAIQVRSTTLLGVCDDSRAERCFQEDPQLTCSGILPSALDAQVTSVELCNWPEIIFDPRPLVPSFKGVKNLTINGEPTTARRFTHVFPAGLVLEVLNISRLGLVSLDPVGLFQNLASTLVLVDARHNQLLLLSPPTFLPLSVLKAVYLAGNPWSCSLDLSWLLDAPLAASYGDLEEWECGPPLYQGKPVRPVVQMLRTLRKQCPSQSPYNCSCTLTNVVSSMTAGGQQGNSNHLAAPLIPVITVNCSNRNLYRVPTILPANTTTLILSKNMISDVRPLANNPHYRRVQDIYLDNNQIRSIATLEGSEWLTTCRVFSLKNNYLSQIPVYAIDFGLGKNKNLAQLFLGNNPWVCDCMYTPGFQDLLAQYQAVIKDINDVKCAKREGDVNSHQQIRHLSRSLLCQEPKVGLSGLDMLNVALALCILIVLGKLAYDYWSFKTSGRLPWLVAKMP